MPTEQIFIGGVTALLCFTGFFHEEQILGESRYGRFLVRLFGEVNGRHCLRGLFLIGITFGVLLATNVIHPIRW